MLRASLDVEQAADERVDERLLDVGSHSRLSGLKHLFTVPRFLIVLGWISAKPVGQLFPHKAVCIPTGA
jgi:hypothetical protein